MCSSLLYNYTCIAYAWMDELMLYVLLGIVDKANISSERMASVGCIHAI